MDKTRATDAFAALSQPLRLDVFRLLIRAGGRGLLAGEIAHALGVRQNTMSANLAVLTRAGLLTNRREGRTIRYFANIDGLRGLLSFLVEECCGGAPETCRPILDAITIPC